MIVQVQILGKQILELMSLKFLTLGHCHLDLLRNTVRVIGYLTQKDLEITYLDKWALP